MDKSVEDFIESGILEAYVIGSASADEELDVVRMQHQYPQVKHALAELESDMEKLAHSMAIPPPPGMWNRIEAEFSELAKIPQANTQPGTYERKQYSNPDYKDEPQYISVEAESTHMRIHKNWKWVFAAVFVLGKIFLACAIYFYLENRQAQQNIEELKQEVKELRGK